jgi:hypothetical protein
MLVLSLLKKKSLLDRGTLRELVNELSAMFLWRRSGKATGSLFLRRWLGCQMTSCRYFLK